LEGFSPNNLTNLFGVMYSFILALS